MRRSSDIVSQIQQRRVDRKRPKINARLKKVNIAERQVSEIATASENKPAPMTLQKTGRRNTAAVTFSIGCHVLVAVVLGFLFIKDQIAHKTDADLAGAFVLPDLSPRIREPHPPAPRPPEIDYIYDVTETPIQPPVNTHTNIPNTSGGLTLPAPSGADFESIDEPSLQSGRIEPAGTLGRPIIINPPTVKPELEKPTSQDGSILEDLDVPDAAAGPVLPTPDIPVPEQGMEAPRPKNHVEPVYPEKAKRVQKEGKVILQATIGIDGIPKDIVAITELGFGLEAAAIAALKKTRYFPAKKNEKAVAGRFNIPFEFKLED